MQILRHTESCHIGDKKTVLLKQISESIKLESGHEAEVFLIAKGKKIHPSIIVGTEKIFDALVENFVATDEIDFYTRFEESIKKANETFANFDESLQNEIINETSIALGIFVEDELFLTQYGIEIEVYLARAKHISTISQDLHENNNKKELFTNIANGKLQTNDIIIWSTERLLRYITKTDLGKIFGSLDIADSLTNLQTTLSTEITTQISVTATKINIQENQENLLIQPEKNNHTDFSRLDKIKKLKNNLKINNLNELLKNLHSKSKDLHQKLIKQDFKTILNHELLQKYKLPITLTVLIIVLIAALFFVQSSAKNRKELQEKEQILNEVQTEINTAISRGTYDSESAANLFQRAEEKTLEVFNSGYLRPKASQILTDIQAQKDKLDKVLRLSAPQLLTDLSKERDDINAIGIINTKDNIFVYEYNTLYKITGDKVDYLKIDENEEIITATYNSDNNEIIFLTKSGKIISYKEDNFQFVDTSDGAWKKGSTIEAYNGKLYMLNSNENQIYRYAPSRNGYGKAENYNVNADLKNAVDISIDGYVYAVDKNGAVKIISGGQNLEFSIQKEALQKITNASKIYTEFEFPYVYILDPTNHKIAIYTKDTRTDNLIYNKQIIFEDISEIKDFAISKDTKSLYVLTQQKVYRVEIE